eukprot:9477267-Pyramimonas_sp.AAC.1
MAELSRDVVEWTTYWQADNGGLACWGCKVNFFTKRQCQRDKKHKDASYLHEVFVPGATFVLKDE